MNIRYALIDTDGQLTFSEADSPFLSDWLNNIVGPEGWGRVRLAPQWEMAAFINDCGLLYPETYPRNVLGSVLAASFGSNPNPCPGNVVFTGWDYAATRRGELEVRPLNSAQEQQIRQCHGDARRALGMDPDPIGPARHPLAAWNAHVREFAKYVETCDVPGPTIVSSPDEVETLLRRMAGDAR